MGNRGNSNGLRPPTMLPTTLTVLAFAAGTDGICGTGAAAAQTWTTEPDYRIDAPGDWVGGFGRSAYLRVAPNGRRIVVRDAEPVDYTTTEWRILVYSPGGGLESEMGPDDFAGDLDPPMVVRAGESGFWLRQRDRAAWYPYGGGNPGETVVFPRGPQLESIFPLATGGFLGLASLSGGYSGWQAVVRLADGDGPDTIAVLDKRNIWLSIILRDPRQRRSFGSSLSRQPFPNDDMWWIDPEAGSIGVVRRNGPPGVAEVFEIVASGDTAWHRRLSLPAVPLSPERAESAIEEKVDGLRAQAESYGLTTAQLRTVVEEALHVPSHLPVVSAVVATASGEVWLKTREVEDDSAVWYSISGSDDESAPRRVLLPGSFRLSDAFGDHVWGFANEDAGPTRIVGLRLVPPPAR